MKKEKGVTLIVLVTTIVIMLLLAGLTISGIQGDNGVFDYMKNKTNQEERKSKEIQEDIDYLEDRL